MKCEWEVWERPGYWHYHPCGKKAKAKVIRNGETKNVCGIHLRKALGRNGPKWEVVL